MLCVLKQRWFEIERTRVLTNEIPLARLYQTEKYHFKIQNHRMTSVVLLYPGQAQSAYRHPVLHLVQGIA